MWWGRDFGAFRKKTRYGVGKMQRVSVKKLCVLWKWIGMWADLKNTEEDKVLWLDVRW